MDLDLRTIVFMTALGSLLTGIAMLLAARSNVGEAGGVRPWAWACGAECLGWILIALRDRIPDLLSIVVGNTAFVLATALFYQAVREFRGEPVRPWLTAGLAGATFLAFLPFTYLVPDVAVRLVIVSAATAALAFACGYTLLSDRREKPLSHQLTGLGFLIACAAIVARAGYLLAVDPARAAGLSPDPVQLATFVANYAAVVLMSFGFVLMRSDRFGAELLRLATHDALTECLNRAAIESRIRAELARAGRHGLPLALLMLDLDHFKAINDRYGHPAGDVALRAVADCLRRQVRVSDSVGRYGGEEFAVLLPDTSAEQAATVAERIRTAVEATAIAAGGETIRPTVSVGIAADGCEDDFESLLRRADAALYEAKARGRNRVVAQAGVARGGSPG